MSLDVDENRNYLKENLSSLFEKYSSSGMGIFYHLLNTKYWFDVSKMTFYYFSNYSGRCIDVDVDLDIILEDPDVANDIKEQLLYHLNVFK